MGFDALVMRQHGISFTNVNLEDTLLAHHAFASHLPQRLDHVVSETLDSNAWKIRFGRRGTEEKGLPPKDMPVDELTLYNAADARLTIKAWHKMQPDLDKERAVYGHDKDLARVCHEMAYAGIGVDLARRDELSNKLSRRRAALKGVMRREIGEPDFSPGKLGEVRRILFQKLKGHHVRLTASGMPSTGNETLEVLRGNDTHLARFADALLRWRIVGKIKSTYIDAAPVNAVTGRAHYNWKPFGTVSGRLSCRLQSCPRWDGAQPEGRAREIYVPKKGNVFVYFDVSQAEMRLAAFLSADPVFMAACDGDVHANNAKAVFPEIAAKGWLDGDAKKDPARGKPYRDIAKNLGFAISYGAEAEKVYLTLRSKGFEITMRAVEMILLRLRTAYKVYYRYVENNLAMVRRDGFMRSPVVGRIRWLGWYPKPTDVANYPVQSSLADIVNLRMISMSPRLPAGVSLVAQIHDACIYDVPQKLASTVEALVVEEWKKSVRLAGGDLVLPIDLKRGERWSDL